MKGLGHLFLADEDGCTRIEQGKLFNNLKGLAQAKIIQKFVILFWLLNMTI